MLLLAYTDGSVMGSIASPSPIGYGGVIVDADTDTIIHQYYGTVPVDYPEFDSGRNVGGEIAAAVHAARWALRNLYYHLTIVHDYEGVGKWPTRQWKTKQQMTREYVRIMDDLSRHLMINYTWSRGHSGNKYNDIADTLAKKGSGG